MSVTDTTKDALASHPRLIGALFALSLLVAQSGTVLAGVQSSNPGP